MTSSFKSPTVTFVASRCGKYTFFIVLNSNDLITRTVKNTSVRGRSVLVSASDAEAADSPEAVAQQGRQSGEKTHCAVNDLLPASLSIVKVSAAAD